ncbi:hypothetical protein [Gimesia maris]|uniref:hypothetical protein n=1 Tax=Gimesia maris TaxID=122 RepID=UPI0012B9FBB8|nr:hypothetical protein [Gimesia maris]|tara:strand:+ start:3185 stop:3625 length:441 start_codon:yes stop_codon:yes gene_type:complete
MKNIQVTLEGLSPLEFAYSLWSDDSERIETLVVSFIGMYQHGSAGSGDGRFMAAMVNAGRTAWLPDALIIDLRGLEYTFGNTILDAINVGFDEDLGWLTPTRIVVSPSCREGITSLLEFSKLDPSDWLCSSIDEAFLRLEEALRED